MSEKKQGNPSPQGRATGVEDVQNGYATKNPEKLSVQTPRPTPKK